MGSSRVAVAAFVALTAAGAQAQGPVSLQYRWKQGDAVTYRTTLQTTTTMSGMPGMGDVTLGQSMTQRIKLLAAAVAPDGSATLHETIEAVSVKMDTPTGSVAYDSENANAAADDEAAAGLGKMFGGIIGGTISVAMAPNGAIQRIDGVAKLVDKVMQDLPSDRSALQIAQGLKSVLSDEAIRASLEQSFPRLPGHDVKPGDTWTAQVALGSPATGRIAGTQTMTLRSVDGGTATVDVALGLKQESTPPIGPQGMTLKLGDSHGAGSIDFDVAGGRIRKATMTTDMPSTLTTTGPDGRPATLTRATKTSMTMEEIR
jgi:hypothetical protein